MSLHRQIWEKNFGIIPKDENGVTYEIHHIDGNNKNNELSNLKCVSLQEHFDIHYEQGDWFACKLIMQKLLIPEEKRAEILKEAGRKISIAMTGKKYPEETHSERNRKISEAKKGKKRPDQSERLKGSKRLGISPLKGKKLSPENIEKRKKTLSLQPIRTCPHCNKQGKGSSMTRYHFNNCKYPT